MAGISGCDPTAILMDAALDYAASEQQRTGREPEVEVCFSNRPRFRYRVLVKGTLVAEGKSGDVERAAREAAQDFERWARNEPAAQARPS